jgi:enoyl-CoA hydratase
MDDFGFPIDSGTDSLLAYGRGEVGTIVFNRPLKHNAMSAEMFTALHNVCLRFELDHRVRVVVLRGAGDRSFISGADIEALNQTGDSSSRAPDAELLPTGKPVVAMIDGFCIGAGMMVALAADIRIASEESVFAIPPAKLGVAYPLDAVERLVGIAGAATASEMLLIGDRYSAAGALRLGLVHRVVSRAELGRTVDGVVDALAANAPLSLRAAKSSVAAALDPSWRPRAEAAIASTWASDDFRAGVEAFAAKQTPRFTGT